MKKDQNQECELTGIQCTSVTHSHYYALIFSLPPPVTESFFQLVKKQFSSEVNVLLIRKGRNFQNEFQSTLSCICTFIHSCVATAAVFHVFKQ